MTDETLQAKYERWLNFHDRQMLRSKDEPGSENSAPGVGAPSAYRTADGREQIAIGLLNHVSKLAAVLESAVLDLAKQVQELKDKDSPGSGK